MALLERLHGHRILGEPRRDPKRFFRQAWQRIRSPRDAHSSGFLTGQFTGPNDELTDPARYQYREAIVLMEAVFEGNPVNYCPFIFVDNDAALSRGWTQGYPKKLGASTRRARTIRRPRLSKRRIPPRNLDLVLVHSCATSDRGAARILAGPRAP